MPTSSLLGRFGRPWSTRYALYQRAMVPYYLGLDPWHGPAVCSIVHHSAFGGEIERQVCYVEYKLIPITTDVSHTISNGVYAMPHMVYLRVSVKDNSRRLFHRFPRTRSMSTVEFVFLLFNGTAKLHQGFRRFLTRLFHDLLQ